MLEEILQKDLVEAMKSHNENAVSAIRSIKTAIQVEKTNGSFHELSDTEITKLIQKLSKQREESYQIYKEAGREDLAANELSEKEFLDKYIPKQMEESLLKSTIDHYIETIGASSMKDMGKVMKELSTNFPNQYDGKLASAYIKEKLS